MLLNSHFTLRLINKKNAFIFILSVSIILSFVRLGGESVAEWDEARNGVNAFEMLKNHDFINLYYNQQPDTWNNKPPLLIWLICLSYKVFGFNEFALRFPSALATVIFFIFFYKIICLHEKPLFAVLSSIILFSTKGIIGSHTGRTGDFDALLICFLIIAAYYFLLYAASLKPVNIYLAAIFLGLAFLTKGTASLCLVPGYLVYLLFKKKFKTAVINRHTAFAVILYLFFVASWIFCITEFGKIYIPESSEYHSHNAVETLFVHDTFNRLAGHLFGRGYSHNWSYFFTVMDAKLNLWNYLFYLTMLVLMLKIFKVHAGRFSYIFKTENKLFTFSLIQTVTLSLILTLSVNKLPWYLTPAFPFVAIVAAYGAKYFYYSVPVFKIILLGVILFTFSRHFIYLCQPDSRLKDFFSKKRSTIEKYNKVYIADQPPQSYLLYLEWNAGKIFPGFDLSQNNAAAGSLFCINNRNPEISKFKVLECFDNNCLAALPFATISTP
jgi:4-amino-4-deoxy-L-arabinose transferase-like glycosyltransferase